MANISSNLYSLELQNGETVNLTLNFAALYKLRAKDKKLYERYNSIITAGEIKDEIDNIEILYVAYVCANINDEYMSFEEFIEFIPYDREEISDVLLALLTPQAKKKDLLKLSKELQKK